MSSDHQRCTLDEHGRTDMMSTAPLDPLEKIVGRSPQTVRDQLRDVVADFLHRACGYDVSRYEGSSPCLHVRIGDAVAVNMVFTVARR